MQHTVVSDEHIGMNPVLVNKVHDGIDITSDYSTMPDWDVVAYEDLTFENKWESTCNGGIGCNEDITNDQWGQIVQLY